MTQGVDPWELPAERWLNLIYYFATRNMDRKAREEFDGELAAMKSRWIAARALQSSVPSVRETDIPAQRERKLPPRPAWFGSDDDATRSNLAAMQTLGGPAMQRARDQPKPAVDS